MSHESVWYSRPRTYGKGSREWYVYLFIHTRPGREYAGLEDIDGQTGG